MLVFFVILILICWLIYLSGIKIQIDNIEIERKSKIQLKDFKVNIYFMLFNKINIIKIKINKEKLQKVNFNKIKNKIEEKIKENSIKTDKQMISDALKELKLKVEKLHVKAKFGLNNVLVMVYLVAIINIIFSILFAKLANNSKKEKYKYIIKPLQTKKLYLEISINCIIKVKIANIINMIIKNRSDVKNERTSNRGFNGNCHEQYTRYGRCKHYNRSTN